MDSLLPSASLFRLVSGWGAQRMMCQFKECDLDCINAA